MKESKSQLRSLKLRRLACSQASLHLSEGGGNQGQCWWQPGTKHFVLLIKLAMRDSGGREAKAKYSEPCTWMQGRPADVQLLQQARHIAAPRLHGVCAFGTPTSGQHHSRLAQDDSEARWRRSLGQAGSQFGGGSSKNCSAGSWRERRGRVLGEHKEESSPGAEQEERHVLIWVTVDEGGSIKVGSSEGIKKK